MSKVKQVRFCPGEGRITTGGLNRKSEPVVTCRDVKGRSLLVEGQYWTQQVFLLVNDLLSLTKPGLLWPAGGDTQLLPWSTSCDRCFCQNRRLTTTGVRGHEVDYTKRRGRRQRGGMASHWSWSRPQDNKSACCLSSP